MAIQLGLRGGRPQILLTLWLIAACRPSSEPDVSARLLEEFAGALPKEVPATGKIRSYELEASTATISLGEGAVLHAWAYNGQVPGPTLRARVGDRLRVRFTNHLPQATTVHWHGVRVPNGMDGVPNLTQPPIEPGESFVYEYTVKDAGTFWYHPHLRSSEQVERGLYGVLIVEDVDPPPYAQDVVWVLDDWLLDERGEVVEKFNTMRDLMHDGRWGNVITVNGKKGGILRGRGGQRIRLRLINSANGRVFAPSFGALRPQIIAVDGNYLRAPIPLDRYELAPGNRLDLDLTLPDASASYPVTDRFSEQRPSELGTIIVEDSAPSAAAFPSPAHAKIPAWTDFAKAPVLAELSLNARRGGPFGIEWTINGIASSGHAHTEAPMLTLVEGSWNRVRFRNDSARLHPIHLHGMFFRLLARNDLPIDEPFFRDTVLIHAKETIDIGVVPLDPGKWMMHCHILEHAEAGMMATIEVTAAPR